MMPRKSFSQTSVHSKKERRAQLFFNGTSGVVLFIFGSILNGSIYFSFEPVFVSFFFIGLVIAVFSLFSLTRFELSSFFFVFSICWIWAGVAAIYSLYAGDFLQNHLDAAYFFKISSGSSTQDFGATFFLENGGAILVFRYFYDLFYALGFNKSPYIGIALNVSMVSMAAIVGLRMVESVFGNDRERAERFIWVFSFCGIFWLYSSIHLRDATILVFVSILFLAWLRYMQNLSATNFFRLLILTVLGFPILGSMRREFVFVPVALFLSGVTAFLFSSYELTRRAKLILGVLSLGLLLSAYVFLETQTDVLEALEAGKKTYEGISSREGSSDSLGNSIIVNQPFPIKVLLGLAYLFLYPIPFWVGFQFDSVYPLFKSLHALFMYVFTPLCIFSFLHFFKKGFRIDSQILFLAFTIIGFALSISYTSLENRHFGVFLPALIVLSLIPDLTQFKEKYVYKRLLFLYLCMIGLIHLAWFALKFVL
ncbi:conserved membrane hypothetical protein [Gammaproteobacteria bacterium]